MIGSTNWTTVAGKNAEVDLLMSSLTMYNLVRQFEQIGQSEGIEMNYLVLGNGAREHAHAGHCQKLGCACDVW